jgi:hypothetical protein
VRPRPAAPTSRDRIPHWLAAQGLSLADARQGDLDEWIASDNATLRRETRRFLRWANSHKLTTLDTPAVRWDGPSGIIDTEARWIARWCRCGI